MSQVKEAVLQASGLTCALCAKSIFTNLSSLPFVANVDTDLNASSFLISFKEDSQVDPQLLRKKVEDAGFFISDLQLKVDVKNKSLGADSFLKESGMYYHVVSGKNENFNGMLTIQVIEKEFLTAKAFKKFSASIELKCFQSVGVADCQVPYTSDIGFPVIHVRVIK
jgi:copper chaperone CopZ